MIREGIILDLFPNDTVWGFGLDAFLTVMWIVGITNSMNFIDGMDGLAAGVAAIISCFLGIVAYQTGQPTMGWVAIAMLGSCLGFMPYNFGMKREAGIFLGDTGSTFIGFVLAAIAVKGEWAVTNNEIVSFSAPVLIFWILIFDMTYITVERIMTGKVRTFREWIDYVGKDHLHHRLYELLRDKRKGRLFHLLPLRDPGDQRHRAAQRPHDRQHPARGPGLPHHGDHLDHRVLGQKASLADVRVKRPGYRVRG